MEKHKEYRSHSILLKRNNMQDIITVGEVWNREGWNRLYQRSVSTQGGQDCTDQ